VWCVCLLMWLHFTTLCMHNCASVIFLFIWRPEGLCSTHTLMIMREVIECRSCSVIVCLSYIWSTVPDRKLPYSAHAGSSGREVIIYYTFCVTIWASSLQWRGGGGKTAAVAKLPWLSLSNMYMRSRRAARDHFASQGYAYANLNNVHNLGNSSRFCEFAAADHISLHAPGRFALNKYKHPEALIYFEWAWPNRYFCSAPIK